MKVPACSSPIVKMDANGRLYRWHCGMRHFTDPSRYYIDTGDMYYETDKGLIKVEDIGPSIAETEDFFCEEDSE